MSGTTSTEIPAVRSHDLRAATRALGVGFGLTDTGQRREANEDAFAALDDLQLYVVCDGMGGHNAGEVASHMAVDALVETFVTSHARGRRTSSEALFAHAVNEANRRIYEAGKDQPHLKGMGTTVAAIRLEGDRATLVHVGDSRVYRWSERRGLEQITRDHSLLNQMLAEGQLTTPEEVAAFRWSNVIVRGVGVREDVEPEVQTITVRPDEVFLLCSDGLTDMVDDTVIGSLIGQHHDALDRAVELLVACANEAGGLDNITVLLASASGAEVTQPAAPPESAARQGRITAPEIDVALRLDDEDVPPLDDDLPAAMADGSPPAAGSDESLEWETIEDALASMTADDD